MANVYVLSTKPGFGKSQRSIICSNKENMPDEQIKEYIDGGQSLCREGLELEFQLYPYFAGAFGLP